MAGAEVGSADEADTSRRDPWGGLTTPVRLSIGPEAITWLALAVGVILRVWGYADGRELYRDERSLLRNLVLLPVFDFHTTLAEYQLAPPGYLVLERMLVRLPGNDVMAARSVALVCGIASLFLFRDVARRLLLPYAVPVAMGFFALSDWLIYYSAEIKHYSGDLALGLATILLTLRAGPSPERSSRRALLALAILGAVGVWFSYTLIFILAAVGTYLMARGLVRGDVRGRLIFAAMGAAWLVSFVGCYVVSHRILSKESFIWNWWDFAFLPIPPQSAAELKTDFWAIANLFDSPSDVKMPIGMIPTAIVAMLLWIVGAISLGRRRPGWLYLLAAPLAFTLAASALHQYPFHGRLLIFLVPAVQMLVAEGGAALARPGGRPLAVAFGVFLLFQPVEDALWYRFIQAINHDAYDSHGDLRPDLLDYLEHSGPHRVERQR
ncbi:MAG: hypothetical protein ACYC61_23330 [Isosphaeraceae bacterium]